MMGFRNMVGVAWIMFGFKSIMGMVGCKIMVGYAVRTVGFIFVFN